MEEKEKKSGGKMVTILLVLVVLMMAGGGFLAYKVLGQKPASVAAAPKAPPAKRAVVKAGEFVTNLAGVDSRRFIKITVDLEVDSEETVKELAGKTSQLRDNVLLVLRGKTVTDLSGPEGMKKLGSEIMEKLNGSVLSSGRATAIYFIEFAIQ